MLAEADYFSLFFALILLIGLAVGGYFVVSLVRKRLREDDSAPSGGTGFVLSDLREMLDQGQITQEEFEKAKHNMVTALQRKANEAAAEAEAGGPKHHPVPVLKNKT